MIEVDDISRGLSIVHPVLLRAREYQSQGDSEGVVSVLKSFINSSEWPLIVEAAFCIDGLVFPHSTWNIVVSLLLQARAFPESVALVRRQFGVDNLAFSLNSNIDHNNILVEYVGKHVVSYFHPRTSEADMWFAVCRFVGIIPMLIHTFNTRQGADGGIQIGMQDCGSGGEASFCSKEEGRVLIPDPLFVETVGYHSLRRAFETTPPYEDREPRAFWRGSTTGNRVTTWRTIPRAILCEIGAQNSSLFDCAITNVVQSISTEEANEMNNSDLIRPAVKSKDFSQYRFHIDIDGNSNSWPGLFAKLLSGGTVFKVKSPEGYRQWYYDRLMPWMHYIPVASDMSDLVEKVTWASQNLARAERIGRSGRALARYMTVTNEMDVAACVIEAALR